MPVKAVLFDLFDTLLLVRGGDAFYEPALRRIHSLLQRRGFNIPYEVFRQAYFEVRDELYRETALAMEEPHFRLRLSRTLKKLGCRFDAEHPIVAEGSEAFAEEFKSHVTLDASAPQVLQELSGKYRLGIVSNISIPEVAWELLEEYDLKKYFESIVISGDVNRRKPSPEIFMKALKDLEVEASEAIFIGDTLSTDIKGAKKVGMYTVLIQREGHTKNLFWSSTEKPEAPDRVIRDLREILELLKNL